MAPSEITKKQPVIFNTVAGCRTPLYIPQSFFKLFMCVVPAFLTFSVLFSPHFLQG